MVELKLSESRDLIRIEHIEHSHIRGLGLDSSLESCTILDDMGGGFMNGGLPIGDTVTEGVAVVGRGSRGWRGRSQEEEYNEAK
ncbi:hypothetical protein JHK82_052789 [Glycine max]|nr:hypothetical protein JHK86_052642 [Glycine max]KAG4927007.1 hypothetical protein JHK85_053493 [Glycine max]KAG5082633.1 hypothetical protein JHK84_052671 [Glycine max]KAG5085392.1 hypothetical protein JHK82_052789 [Glycine max]